MTEQVQSPDVGEIVMEELTAAEFPAPQVLERLRVYLEPEVHTAMIAHACENTHIELCGVMLGNLLRDEYGPFLRIIAAVRGEHAANQAAQVTFTQETWTHIHHEMDTRYPGLKMVGWYHTHPGFGIFLSNMDLFIHENFFNLPENVAFVIDPQSSEEGFFCWKLGVVKRIQRYWVGAEEKTGCVEAIAGGGALDQRVASLQCQVDSLSQSQRRIRGRIRILTIGLVGLATILVAQLGFWTMELWEQRSGDKKGPRTDKEANYGTGQDPDRVGGPESAGSGQEAGAGAQAEGGSGAIPAKQTSVP
jgi:proteasome lid subunit RPN8/RPN11